MWFIYDACGIVCCVITYGVMLLISGICTKIAIAELASEEFMSFYWGLCGYIILVGLAAMSHMLCMLTNPGTIEIVPYELSPTQEKLNFCYKCNCFKPPRAHHCSVCAKCIQKMDHHCPWVNNCIGLYNQKHFLLFLFYIELACMYSLILLMLRGTYCFSHKEVPLCKRENKEVAADMVLGVISLFSIIVFSLFIGTVLYDQIVCIMNNTTGIDSLKDIEPQKRPIRESFEEVFGGKFGLTWFLPTPIGNREYNIIDVIEL